MSATPQDPPVYLVLGATGRVGVALCRRLAAQGARLLVAARDTTKLAALCEAYGVRTAWHGPGDVSPVGHAANVHLDLAVPNFGIQEWSGMSETLKEVFPGSPELRGGYVYLNGKPGLGIDIDEKLAAKFPCDDSATTWTQTRLIDGTAHQP